MDGATPPARLPSLPPGFATRITSLGGSDPALTNRLRLFTAELIAFQNRRLAETYLDHLETLRDTTALIDQRRTTLLVDRVATGLHKLMAYKDEYEVARLMLDPDGHAPVGAVARRGDRVAWRLQPPLLRALGLSSKLSLSTRWRPVFALLRRGKWLRGSFLDPFGRSRVRRIERELPDEYLDGLRRALDTASTTGNLDDALLVAELPDLVRGYEDVKLRNVERFRTRMAELTLP